MKKYYFLIFCFFFSYLLSAQERSSSDYYNNPLQLSITGGYGYRIGKVDTDPAFEQHLKNLKNGYVINFDAVYFLDPELGFGLKYNRFGSKATLNGNYGTQAIEDNTSIDFFGGQFATRWILANPRHAFVIGVSPGYTAYRDKASVGSSNVVLSGGGFGFAGDLGYNYTLSRHAAITVNIGYLLSSFKHINSSNEQLIPSGDLPEKEELSHYDISLGMRFNL